MRELVKDKERLEHILEAIDLILGYASGKDLEELVSDSLKFYGIVKNIEIIGEAAYKLTNAYRSLHKETPWDVISKMRHILVHEYYQIDAEQICNVIREDLVTLRDQISSQIENTNWEEWDKNESAIFESVTHKSLIQTALRMKRDGFTGEQISRYTGLKNDEIEDL